MTNQVYQKLGKGYYFEKPTNRIYKDLRKGVTIQIKNLGGLEVAVWGRK